MKLSKSLFVGLCICAISLSPLFGQSDLSDKTLAPYFYRPLLKENSVDDLPLRSTQVNVQISGVIADVEMVQEYQNMGNEVIEAIYCFPLSTRAAVHGMDMYVGKRLIRAKIQEKKKAKKTFETAKREGKTASLLEQHRPNVFQMNVANILPGDSVKIVVKFTELLVPEQKVYSFVFPTVVGPRYSEVSASETDPSKTWVQNPYLKDGLPVIPRFDLRLSLKAGMPVQDVICRTHKVDTVFVDKNTASLSLSSEEVLAANRDFVLEYRLAGDSIHFGVLLHEGEKENFFLMMVQPPERPSIDSIPPRDYIFILDVSGSMSGFPLDTSKEIMRSLFATLRPEDSFNLVLFAGESKSLGSESLPATTENINRAWALFDSQSGGGSTRLLPALKHAFKLAKEENVSRSLVILTDGYVDVELKTFDLIRDNLGTANLFVFGIGSSVNRFIIEGMAQVGQGEPFIVLDIHDAAPAARRFSNYVGSPLLTGIELDFQGLNVYDVEPKTFPDMFADRPLVVYGKWKGEASGSVTLKGFTGEGSFEQVLDVAESVQDSNQPALPYLWARNKLALLSDYNELDRDSEYKLEATNIALTYNLASKFTSFVAVDETPRNADGSFKTVKQPALLPKGVSTLAFDTSMPSTPEPRTFIMGGGILLVLAFVLARKRKLIRQQKG